MAIILSFLRMISQRDQGKALAMAIMLSHESLQTQRITLRAPIPEDDEALIALFSDPKTMHHLPVLLNQPWDAHRMAARRQARAQDELQGLARNFTIILNQQAVVIGQAGYRTLTEAKRGELGLILAHAHHGRGLVWDVHLLLLSLGFQNLGLEVVEWLTGEDNEPMLAVLRKLGCKEAGIVVEDDEWGKQVKFSLEKKDWMECKAWLCERVDRLSSL